MTNKNINSKNIIFLIISFLILFLYFYQLTNIPGFNGDDAWFMSKSLDIKNHGLFKNIGGMGNYTGVLHPYLMYLSNLIFPNIIFAGRILNLISVVMIIFILIKLLNKQIQNNLILLLILLFALNPFNFGFYRVAWPHSLLPLFSIAGIYFFKKYIETQKLIYIGAALILAGLGAQLHPVMTLQVGYYILYVLIYQRQLAKKIIFSKTFVILVICFLVGSFSVVYFNITAVKRLFGIHINNIIETGIFNVLIIIATRFTAFTKIFINNFTSYPTLEYFSGILYTNSVFKILMLLFSILLLISAILNCLAKNSILKNIFGLHTLFFFFVIPFFLEFGGFNMHKLHLGEERIFLIMTPAIFTNYILSAENLKFTVLKIFYLFTALIITINLFNIGYNYMYNFKTTGGKGAFCYFINDRDLKLIAAEYITENFSDTDTIIFAQDYWLYWPLKIYLYDTKFEIYYAPKCRIPREGWPEINDFNELYQTYSNKNLLFIIWNNIINTQIEKELENLKLIKKLNKKNNEKIITFYLKDKN